MALTREQVLGADDLGRQEVLVPQWDGSVFVRIMTGAERDQFESIVQGASGAGGKMDLRGLRATLVAMTACDADGEALFSMEDVEALQCKSAAALDVVFTVSQRLNGLRPEDIEDLVGNSEGDRSGDSG